MAHSEGIRLKKKFGQHFLRDERVVQHMIEAVTIGPNTSVFEIGCGDGFLTQAILRTNIARLFVFEIDPEWAKFVRDKFKSDVRLYMFEANFLDQDLSMLDEHKPWTVLANLPYQVTFPILHRFHEVRHRLAEGVVMVQEEVAQKITKTHGRGYGFSSLFFQHYFEWKQLDKIPPTAFHPAPKIFSRLLYFKPKKTVTPIPQEAAFWEFITTCFKQPRRMLRNNLRQAHYDESKLSEETLSLRAQQMSMEDFLVVWDQIRT